MQGSLFYDRIKNETYVLVFAVFGRKGVHGMLIQGEMSLQEKLHILSDAAKYDVACTSSGSGRSGRRGRLGNTSVSGICHSFSADGRCISLLKILYTNDCIYDCCYCQNRRSNHVVRASFTPGEVCTLTVEFYRRNYIEGLFLSSGIVRSPEYTMEQIYQTLYRLRVSYHFHGYIHVKVIPGAPDELVRQVGYLADRVSVNLELPTAEGLRLLAPGKTREKILRPMKLVQQGIAYEGQKRIGMDSFHGARVSRSHSWQPLGGQKKEGRFVPAGQSTQMIVGATQESDYHMMMTAQALYRNYALKRVFYSAFVRVNDDSRLPVLPGGPPLLREHRLYQGDWLLRFYGFQAEELLSELHPNFNVLLDPKCDWALRHLGLFPVEVNHAGYDMLLRVPGVGVKSAKRIVAARGRAALDFPDLKKLGVVLKRAMYFLTCSGKTMVRFPFQQDFITSQLIGEEHRRAWDIENQDSYRQLSLFDDYHVSAPVAESDVWSVATGSL